MKISGRKGTLKKVHNPLSKIVRPATLLKRESGTGVFL